MPMVAKMCEHEESIGELYEKTTLRSIIGTKCLPWG